MSLTHYANKLLFLFLLAPVAGPGYAANAAGLGDVVEAAILRHPDRSMPDAVEQQGRAIRRQADGLLAGDPAIALRHENDEVTDNLGFRSWEGSVQLPLWLPGQRKRRLEVADATGREAASLVRLHKWQVSDEVRELLWSIRIAAAEEALARLAADSARELEADVERRVQAGELAASDLVMARKETLNREIAVVNASTAHSALLGEYRLLTGLATLPESIEEQPFESSGLPEDHPALVATGLGAERARVVSERVRHERRDNPVLALGARNERSATGQPDDNILTVELTLPLGLPGQSATRIADAERQVTEEQAVYERLRRDLEKQLVSAIAERKRTTQALDLAQRHRQLAAEGLRMARRAFELGESDLFALLQAHTQAFTSDRDLQMRQLELGRAVARLNQALGVIPE